MTVKQGNPEIRMIPVDKLIPYSRNARKHPEPQIDQIAASIKEFGFLAPLVVAADNTIIAGHGRLAAAKKLGIENAPCVVADHLTDAQRRAYVLIDNRLTDTSEWDKELLQIELGDLALTDIDIGLMGFSPPEIEELELPTIGDDDDANGETQYSKKIEVPIYEPTGEKPTLDSLCDSTKTDALLAKIKSTPNLPDDIKTFLIHAAGRHRIFNYQNIAEFYAHSTPEIQSLFEESALVIIDFGKAIEQGFIELSEKIAEEYLDDKE